MEDYGLPVKSPEQRWKGLLGTKCGTPRGRPTRNSEASVAPGTGLVCHATSLLHRLYRPSHLRLAPPHPRTPHHHMKDLSSKHIWCWQQDSSIGTLGGSIIVRSGRDQRGGSIYRRKQNLPTLLYCPPASRPLHSPPVSVDLEFGSVVLEKNPRWLSPLATEHGILWVRLIQRSCD